MLKVNPSERISTINALKHNYFKDLPESCKNIYLKNNDK